MLNTRFTELVGCAVPIQQAGMGSPANPRLAAAVANGGIRYHPTILAAVKNNVGQILHAAEPKISGKLPANKRTLNLVKEGLWQVVNGNRRVGNLQFAALTTGDKPRPSSSVRHGFHIQPDAHFGERESGQHSR